MVKFVSLDSVERRKQCFGVQDYTNIMYIIDWVFVQFALLLRGDGGIYYKVRAYLNCIEINLY